MADSNGHDYQWVQWLHKTFSNPSWTPIFIGMEVVTGIADDMVIAGRDEMEHDRNFLAFMVKVVVLRVVVTYGSRGNSSPLLFLFNVA